MKLQILLLILLTVADTGYTTTDSISTNIQSTTTEEATESHTSELTSATDSSSKEIYNTTVTDSLTSESTDMYSTSTSEDHATLSPDDATSSYTTDVYSTVTSTVESYWLKWTAWGPCMYKPGSVDSCEGYHSRQRQFFSTGHWIKTDEQCQKCYFTTEKVNGNYSTWTEWEDCSTNCKGKTSRYRTCNNPPPCNGGRNCSVLGVDTLTKDCGPVDGGWSTWGEWSTCLPENMTSIYGIGNHTRSRNCSDPEPVCSGEPCEGIVNETGLCTVIPPCLTSEVFDQSYLSEDSPMVVYTSAKVIIEALSQNLCFTNTSIFYSWELFKRITDDNGTVTEIKENRTSSSFYFLLQPHDLKPGLYRLHVKIGYPEDFTHWMVESMYLKLEHPPPNTFIKGGTGRYIGEGSVNLDGKSGSYSLKNGPGDPSGLVFEWACLNFVTNDIYKLLSFKIDPLYVFLEQQNVEKWYNTDFLQEVNEKLIRINASTLYTHVQSLDNATGKLADDYNVTIRERYQTSYVAGQDDGSSRYDLFVNDNYTNYYYYVIETRPFQDFFHIKYMKELSKDAQPKIFKEIVLPSDNELVRNEYNELVNDLFYEGSLFVEHFMDFLDLLSDSYLTMLSLYNFEGVPIEDLTTNSPFLIILDDWLRTIKDIHDDLDLMISTINTYTSYVDIMEKGLQLTDYIKMDDFLQLYIRKTEKEFKHFYLDFLRDFYNIILQINQVDWNRLEMIEKNYTNWLYGLVDDNRCAHFSPKADGYAELQVQRQDVVNGVGYLIYLRAIFEGSYGYFVQHAQTIDGDPPELELECRLNCMKKTATTSILSLVAVCPFCTMSELTGATFSWNFKYFPFNTRKVADYPNWQDMMLSGLYDKIRWKKLHLQ
ncbi:HMCN [Mytilus coruscus]|uniref:HMCN n=1 Tax=Mytilus coruscus TaxID=42192 RepID=A0A6J8B436_MYTCO|nr:HMCN [Mytilus coruscus]